MKDGKVKGAETIPKMPPKLRKLDARILETPTEATRSDVTIDVYADAFLYVTEYATVTAAVTLRDRNNFCCWKESVESETLITSMYFAFSKPGAEAATARANTTLFCSKLLLNTEAFSPRIF